MPSDDFEHALSALKRDRGVRADTDLTAEDLQELVGTFKGIVAESAGADAVGDDPREQLRLDRKSTRLNSSHSQQSRMPSSA